MESTEPPPGTLAKAPQESSDVPEKSSSNAGETTSAVVLHEEQKTSLLPSSSLQQAVPSSSIVNPNLTRQPQIQPQSRPPQPLRPVRPSQFPASASSPSATSSSSSNLQRSGMAIGVPASLQNPRAPQQSSVPGPFSSFGPSPPFSQSYSSQGRQPVQSSGLGAQATSLRPGGITGNYQQRPGQTSFRSSLPSTIQSSTNQKFQPGPFRGPSLSSPGSQSPSQQPWLTSTSFRPQSRAPLTQPRPTQPLVATSLAQQSTTGQQLSQKPQQQLPLSKVQQPVYLPHQVKSQKSTIQPPLQSGALQPGSIPPSRINIDGDNNDGDSGNQIISKRTIRDLVAQIDPSERLDPEVEDILVEVAEDFVESITTFGCSLAKHRKSTTLEAKDILLHLERNWNMTIPGFGGDEIKSYKKLLTNDVHKERLALIRKSMASATEAGNAKNSAAGQSTAHGKSHAPKASSSLIGSPKLA